MIPSICTLSCLDQLCKPPLEQSPDHHPHDPRASHSSSPTTSNLATEQIAASGPAHAIHRSTACQGFCLCLCLCPACPAGLPLSLRYTLYTLPPFPSIFRPSPSTPSHAFTALSSLLRLLSIFTTAITAIFAQEIPSSDLLHPELPQLPWPSRSSPAHPIHHSSGTSFQYSLWSLIVCCFPTRTLHLDNFVLGALLLIQYYKEDESTDTPLHKFPRISSHYQRPTPSVPERRNRLLCHNSLEAVDALNFPHLEELGVSLTSLGVTTSLLISRLLERC